MNVHERFNERARAWDVAIEHALETETSLVGFGLRGKQTVVLKVLRRQTDEWTSGEVVRAFQGHGVVRVYESVDGAMLLERLTPGHSLMRMALDGMDEEAIAIIAEAIRQMADSTPPPACATVHDWAKGFERYSAIGGRQIPEDLFGEGRRRFAALASSQQHVRLLHGDLHHQNVLFDGTRGWLAIDPKGVVGEIEYEIGAALRNPIERPDLFVSTAIVERRLTAFAKVLSIDLERALEWGFAQAVLSAIRSIEDGETIDARSPALALANAILPLLSCRPVIETNRCESEEAEHE